MNLHPYDNIERRYRHTDLSITEGLLIVARLLHLAQSLTYNESTFFDLSFFSGGMGVLDRLAIRLPAGPELWQHAGTALQARTPEEMSADVAVAEDFRWLLCGDEEWSSPRLAAVQFINSERHSFHRQCRPTDRILFAGASDVNDWVALWGDDTEFNYLGFSQG